MRSCAPVVTIGARSIAHVDDAVGNLQWDIPAELWQEFRSEGLLPEHVPTP